MPGSTVSNTSPLYYLHRLGLLQLLPQLFGKILIPSAVASELDRGHREGHGAPDVATLEWLSIVPIHLDEEMAALALHQGELEAIALAIKTPDCLILLDDWPGRLEAQRRGLELTGTGGVLIRAKERGLVSAVKPWLEQLPGLGFRLSSAVYLELLKQAGEE